MAGPSTRLRAIRLYKELHRLGRDYPDEQFVAVISTASSANNGSSYNFHGKLRKLFDQNRSLTDPEEIEKALKLGEYIKAETLALYSLRKYRHLKQNYPASGLPP
ncbi:hypothetical protein GYMLUDRAFT_242567 [Collybiopsis luxurians FD-317 M1]|uniref:Complex 1 LYR protein domain-containing protein n=1 Tax=Collybiopsis luxurians FD-317 M1 TaxID=944289 RepID=A0A0D0BF10_9AGAR|nr:hypothetical protein GYMLUDRAFT_242567 [Collybiopsis luxurians FD-317 M1]